MMKMLINSQGYILAMGEEDYPLEILSEYGLDWGNWRERKVTVDEDGNPVLSEGKLQFSEITLDEYDAAVFNL